jgi:hypothetical protein
MIKDNITVCVSATMDLFIMSSFFNKEFPQKKAKRNFWFLGNVVSFFITSIVCHPFARLLLLGEDFE